MSERRGVEGAFDYVTAKLNGGANANSRGYRIKEPHNLVTGHRLVPYLSAGDGGNTIAYSGNAKYSTNPPLDRGAMVKRLITDSWTPRGDVRNIILFDNVLSNLEYAVRLSYLPELPRGGHSRLKSGYGYPELRL